MSKSYLDQTWESLFKKYNILDELKTKGFFVIKAEQIKEFREPRLVTKFDHSINLPQIFKHNNVSILPISRKEYVLSNHQMFYEFEPDDSYPIQKPFPLYIESIDRSEITSESVALNTSYIAGMLEDFIEDANMVPTVSGRMGSGRFSFKIKNSLDNSFNQVDVDNSQIEIDGAFEGEKFLTLIEAKQHVASDFLIRQIYFPFRTWKDKVSKEIKLVYFTYSNGIFNFFEYKFEDESNYSSLKLMKQKKYTLEDTKINLETIVSIANAVSIVDEPKLPFPQADDFKKVINLCEIAYTKELSKEIIASEYEFNIRQSDYYTNACRYLGLLEKYKANGSILYKLTDAGQNILKMSYIERQLYLVKEILSHKIFNDIFKQTIKSNRVPTKNEILKIMPSYKLHNVGSKKDDASTFGRRASSIKGWIEWILSIIEE